MTMIHWLGKTLQQIFKLFLKRKKA